MNAQERQAYESGQHARDRGKGEFDGPLYGMGEEGQALRKLWRKGWNNRDLERKRK